MPGKLNIFQRTMLRWNESQPYNALHAVEVFLPLDLPRLTRLINGELERLGLTGLSIDRRQGAFEYRGGPARLEVKRVPVSGDARASLEREMEAQLNMPFDYSGPTTPFRFFVVEETGGFYFGLTYFHVVAGGGSIPLLVKHLVGRYEGREEAVLDGPLDVYPGRYRELTPRKGVVLWRKLLAFPSMVSNLNRSLRPRCPTTDDPSVGLSAFRLPPEDLRELIGIAKRTGVKLNDLFLAMFLKALSPIAARRLTHRRQKLLTVACVVNSGDDLGVDKLRSFGLFVGSFFVSHPVPEGIPLEDLAKAIHRQTQAIKARKLYLAHPFELWMSRALLSVWPRSRRRRFYADNYPVWGGLTNANVNPLWGWREGERPFAHFRAVSTGPATSLVFAPTTAGDAVSVCLIYRKAFFKQSEIEKVISGFADSVRFARMQP